MEQIKRGRGRPRKDSGAGGGNSDPSIQLDGVSVDTSSDEAAPGSGELVIDPTAFVGGSGSSDSRSSGNEPRSSRRGRKPGSGSASKKAAGNLSVSGVEKILYAMHMGVASLTKTPELMLDQAEATLLAGAITEVSKHYDMLDKVSDKAVAWVGLIQTVGVIYGPRALVIAGKRKKRSEEPPHLAAVA